MRGAHSPPAVVAPSSCYRSFGEGGEREVLIFLIFLIFVLFWFEFCFF